MEYLNFFIYLLIHCFTVYKRRKKYIERDKFLGIIYAVNIIYYKNRVLQFFCNNSKNLSQQHVLEKKLTSIETTILDVIRNLREALSSQDKIFIDQ